MRIDRGMSNPEIADIMDVSAKRVRNLIYEGTKKLKEEVARVAGWLVNSERFKTAYRFYAPLM